MGFFDLPANLVNLDYDLYSKGKDEQTSAQFVSKNARDDIVRVNDGKYYEVAEKPQFSILTTAQKLSRGQSSREILVSILIGTDEYRFQPCKGCRLVGVPFRFEPPRVCKVRLIDRAQLPSSLLASGFEDSF